jgi:hypothetical protein
VDYDNEDLSDAVLILGFGQIIDDELELLREQTPVAVLCYAMFGCEEVGYTCHLPKEARQTSPTMATRRIMALKISVVSSKC